MMADGSGHDFRIPWKERFFPRMAYLRSLPPKRWTTFLLAWENNQIICAVGLFPMFFLIDACSICVSALGPHQADCGCWRAVKHPEANSYALQA